MEPGLREALTPSAPTSTTTTPTLQPTLSTISPQRADDLHVREAAGDLSASEQTDLNLFRQSSLMPPAPRVQPDDPVFAATAQKYNLPPHVLPGIMATESGDWRNPWVGGDPSLVPPVAPPMAPSSARGLMQITKDGSAYGLNDYNWSNPYVSVDVAGHMLRDKIDQHGGNLDAGLNSYGGAGIGKNPADYNQRVRHAMGAIAAGRPGAAAIDLPHGDQLPIYPAPQGFVFHHSGGTDLSSLVTTLRQRGLGSEYLMDRDGTIYAFAPPGSRHMKPNDEYRGAAPGLRNENSLGMEIVGQNDGDISPTQIAAARQFIAKNYPNVPVYGHGEVNPGHKQPSEGLTVATAIRADRQAQPAQPAAEPTTVAGPPAAAPEAAPEAIPHQLTGRVTPAVVMDPETGKPAQPATEPVEGTSPVTVTGETLPPGVGAVTPTTRTLKGAFLARELQAAEPPAWPSPEEPWYTRWPESLATGVGTVAGPVPRMVAAIPSSLAAAGWERYGNRILGLPVVREATGGPYVQGPEGAEPGKPLPQEPSRATAETVGGLANLATLAVPAGRTLASRWRGGALPFPASALTPEELPPSRLLPGGRGRQLVGEVSAAEQAATGVRQQMTEARRGAAADIQTLQQQGRDIQDVEAAARQGLPDATDQAITALQQHQNQIERDFLTQRDVVRRQEALGFNKRRLQALDQLAPPEGGAPMTTERAPPGAEARSAGRALRGLREEGYTGPASITAPGETPTRAPSEEMNPALVEHRQAMQDLGDRLGSYQELVERARTATNPAQRLVLAQQAERLAETQIPEVTRAASLQRQLEDLGPAGRQGVSRAIEDRRTALEGQLNDLQDRLDEADATRGAAGRRLTEYQSKRTGRTIRRIATIGLGAAGYGWHVHRANQAIEAYRALSDQ